MALFLNYIFQVVFLAYSKGKGKGHPCTDTETLYRPYGPEGE